MNVACILKTAAGFDQCVASSSQRKFRRLELAQEEVEEVEQKLTEAEHSRSQMRRICTKFCTPVFLEAFVLTFLAGVCCADNT